ncbi:TRAP transporter large permease [Suttonella indologenes]|uniref:TRAP transporter large permease protein n=1 Tax=Suttonella indologenes TaxID=13276 RepID=A0A380MLW8_9GAMM|nr:TRAP transporter large permease subunit [Suttonella indologenes]SUO91363.1 Neu5Ac permease [Suttonella indologenes]
MEWLAIVMFVALGMALLMGYPVALSLAGVALIFAGMAPLFDVDMSVLPMITNRLFGGVMTNETLISVPTFVFMGLTLQKAKIAEDLLSMMTLLFGGMRGGLAFTVTIVGALLAAATGIVGATVVTMTLLSLPVMLKNGYDPKLSTGVICASGTLGQIIPPSIVLIVLGDVVGNAYSESQMKMGNFAPDTVSVSDLFAGAVVPGLCIVGLYLLYIFIRTLITPNDLPLPDKSERAQLRGKHFYLRLLFVLLPPLALILCVLGSILMGLATPTEAASIGAFGALVIAFVRYLVDRKNGVPSSLRWLIDVPRETLQISAMVFLIMIGASLFSLVFRAYGGDLLIEHWLSNLPGGKIGAIFVVMFVIFVLGFVLDYFEIVFIVIPIVAPILFQMDVDPVWFAIMVAINLQTSFLTPPFGFALFFLRGVAPISVKTADIYKGVIPFIALQLLMLVILAFVPQMVRWVSF